MRRVKYLLSKLISKSRIPSILRSRIDPTSKVEPASQVVDSTFDRHSFCGYGCQIVNCDVGSFCSIANGVSVGGGVHPLDWVSTSPVFYWGRDSVKAKFSVHRRPPPLRTKIGHDVWIGERAIIKAGVVIGTGAVVGMGAVVTKDVAPYAIVAGVPASRIRDRFDEETIRLLLQSRWWESDDESLRRAAQFIREPRKFVQALCK
jgi:acetyltransferase-like isoleucine patch superfamily enzyme